jgi:hypothetical protein
METNAEKPLFRDEVFQIVGCAIVEKPYENALAVELGLRKIRFRQQPAFDVLYKAFRTSSLSILLSWIQK